MAKTIHHERIGGLIAIQASLGGALTLGLVVTVILVNPEPGSEKRHLVMIAAAAVIWLLAAVAVSRVTEQPKRYNATASPWSMLRQGFRLYGKHQWFRRYTAVRFCIYPWASQCRSIQFMRHLFTKARVIA